MPDEERSTEDEPADGRRSRERERAEREHEDPRERDNLDEAYDHKATEEETKRKGKEEQSRYGGA